MKTFLEIMEQVKEKEEKIPLMVKLEVKSDTEIKQKLLEQEPKFVGLNYVKRIHKCYHDEKTNQPCEIVNL